MCERDLRRRAASNVVCEIQGFQVALTKNDDDPGCVGEDWRRSPAPLSALRPLRWFWPCAFPSLVVWYAYRPTLVERLDAP
jgi:hypothetical protein